LAILSVNQLYTATPPSHLSQRREVLTIAEWSLNTASQSVRISQSVC